MYKVELSFDTNLLDVTHVESLCMQTDEIFEKEDLSCADRQPGKRIYQDKGRKQDYGILGSYFCFKGYERDRRKFKGMFLV